MAFTINRNGEITQEEFKKLRKRFHSKTNTQAIYDCVHKELYKNPLLEQKYESLKKAHLKSVQQLNELIRLIKQKNIVDHDFDNKLFPMLQPFVFPEIDLSTDVTDL
jgi:hypothetical protein